MCRAGIIRYARIISVEKLPRNECDLMALYWLQPALFSPNLGTDFTRYKMGTADRHYSRPDFHFVLSMEIILLMNFNIVLANIFIYINLQIRGIL